MFDKRYQAQVEVVTQVTGRFYSGCGVTIG